MEMRPEASALAQAGRGRGWPRVLRGGRILGMFKGRVDWVRLGELTEEWRVKACYGA